MPCIAALGRYCRRAHACTASSAALISHSDRLTPRSIRCSAKGLLRREAHLRGTVRIDGKLSGEIFSDDVLVIGEGAQVAAEIEVGVIIIEGTVTGNIRARRAVELHAPARVRGNIETPSLYIDKGVLFEGNCRMENLTPPAAVEMKSTPTLTGIVPPIATTGATTGTTTPPARSTPPSPPSD